MMQKEPDTEADEILELLPDACAYTESEGWALRRGTVARLARGEGQNAIIQALSAGCARIDDLEEAVRCASSVPLRDDEASLAVARFILDFGEFLKN
jgi:hypothetical protein